VFAEFRKVHAFHFPWRERRRFSMLKNTDRAPVPTAPVTWTTALPALLAPDSNAALKGSANDVMPSTVPAAIAPTVSAAAVVYSDTLYSRRALLLSYMTRLSLSRVPLPLTRESWNSTSCREIFSLCLVIGLCLSV